MSLCELLASYLNICQCTNLLLYVLVACKTSTGSFYGETPDAFDAIHWRLACWQPSAVSAIGAGQSL